MNESLENRIGALEARVTALEQRLTEKKLPRETTDGILSPREFLLGKAPRGDNDTTLAAGYYLEILAKKDGFTFDDLADFYNQAKEALPANRRDPPYQNVKRGYFREIGGREAGKTARNRWALTNLGIERVEKGFAKAR